jgi:hypothetical protein
MTQPHKRPFADLGISKDQSSRWQQLADVPEDQFEAALAGPEKPPTAGIVAQAKLKPATAPSPYSDTSNSIRPAICSGDHPMARRFST